MPTQAAWMTPPKVPGDAKFKWWSDLRRVPTSYISSRGESERFLYYDGPTLAKPPFVASLNGQSLNLHSQEFLQPSNVHDYEIDTPALQQEINSRSQDREGFFIRVTGGRASAMRFPIANFTNAITQDLPATLPIGADDAVSELRRLLTDYGLTPEESDGLISAWTRQFFQTDGQRLLLRLSAWDYDLLCPISIRPPPTTLVRLGFVLTEF